MNIGNYVRKFWRQLSAGATVVILLGAAVFVFESLPPRTIVMATGVEGDANYELGIRYREILAREGIELKLQPTSGSLDNLRRLRDSGSGVSVGFIQGGTTTRKESPELESLGTIFYEPLWLFRRAEIGEGAQNLRGRRVSIGPEGSGGRALALQILSRTRLDSIIGELSGLTPQVAAEKLIAGEIDAAFIVTGWEFSRRPVSSQHQRHRGRELHSRRRFSRNLSFSAPAGPACRGHRSRSQPPASGYRAVGTEGQSCRARGSEFSLAVPVARCSRPDLFTAWNFPEGGTIPCCRINRSSAEWRSTPFLQIRTTISARLPSVLDRNIGRNGPCRTDPFGRVAIPRVQAAAANVRLDDATEDQAALRPNQVDRERYGGTKTRVRRQRFECETGSD